MGQRVALYCRVSTADQSCARQERDLTAFAARAGYDVVGIFKESGSGAKLDRAERKKVMALAQRREVDAVLVTELSRWGRSTLDLLHTLKELESRRVSVIAMNGLAFDLSTPHGRMMATIIAGIAEFERELIQERIRSGIAAAKARGKRLGRQPGQPSAACLPAGCVFSNRCPHVEPACISTEPVLDSVLDHQVACRRWQELRSDARAA